jgi:regulator of sigma D
MDNKVDETDKIKKRVEDQSDNLLGYNNELEKAEIEFERGEYITHQQLLNLIKTNY